jgi:hypothetical protein
MSTIEQGVGEEGCKLASPSAINTLPETQQTAVFIGTFALLFAGTAGLLALSESFVVNFSELAASAKPLYNPSLLGLIYTLAGISHFTIKKEFMNIYPYRGAWGLWYLPGSSEFHVLWTGMYVCHTLRNYLT